MNRYATNAWSLVGGNPHPQCFNISNKDGQTPLHCAVIHSAEVQLVRSMVVLGAETALCDLKGNTPLHDATLNGDRDTVVSLFSALTSEERSFKQRFYSYSSEGGELGFTRSDLLNCKQNDRKYIEKMVDQQNSEGKTALYSAVESNHPELVKFLVEQHANPLLFVRSLSFYL